jgi:nickel superoxide dismutase
MFRKILFTGIVCSILSQAHIAAHCQMPCGIYHDEMVFDQIDQYVETMVKCVSVLEDDKFKTIQDYNVATRWIMEKETASNDIADVITIYFLQQKIKPGEEDTTKRLISAHKLLFYLVQIKQLVDLRAVNDFYEEWEKFKLMFHIEGYKCKVSQMKLQKWREKQDQSGKPKSINYNDDHDHDHDDHDHDHTH